jgi:ISXO2-like transposase domain
MLPTLFDINNILFSEIECIDFLLEEDILYKQATCPRRREPMVRDDKRWRCPKRPCRRSVSIFRHTLFFDCHIPCNKVLLVGYLWLARTTSLVIQRLTGHSAATIARLLCLFRQLVASDLDERTEGEGHMIGGEDIIVEIYESKFHNPHTNDPRINARVGWVFGGVERTAERHVFVERVEDRSADTLLAVIRRRVRPGSIILSDCWSAYDNIQAELGLEHWQVNHSHTFVDPLTGAHTNTIEGTWHGLKLAVPQRQRAETKIDGYLLEFMWRRENQDDEWMALLRCLREIAFV